jgi:hypothetical protein
VVHALERLQNQGDDKAGQFLASIMQFQFNIAAVIAEHILHSTIYSKIVFPFFLTCPCARHGVTAYMQLRL